MTCWRHLLRNLALLALLLSVATAGAACKSKAEQNQEVKEEQKKESQSPPQGKEKNEFVLLTRTIPGVPQSVDEFKKLHAAEATTPEGAAATFVAALLAVSEKVPGADQMVAITLTPNQLQSGGLGSQAKERFVRGIGERPGVAPSYVKGATPGNGYKLPAPPFTVELHRDPTDPSLTGDQKKIFVWSSGASSPRGLTVIRQSSGVWLVHEASSLASGVSKK